MTEVAIFAISAAGLTVLTGINGQVSLGHGALMMIGAYTTSVLLTWHADLPLILMLLASIADHRNRRRDRRHRRRAAAGPVPRRRDACACGCAAAGAVALRQRVRGQPGIQRSDAEPTRLSRWGFLAGAVACLDHARRRGDHVLPPRQPGARRDGRRFRMVRDNEVAARLSGIDVARTQVLAYVISAACAGLAGSLFAYWVTVTSPSGFTLNLSLSLLTAIVIGGLGSLSGAVIGSFILVYLPRVDRGFRQQPQSLEQCGQQCSHWRSTGSCSSSRSSSSRGESPAGLRRSSDAVRRMLRSSRRAGALPAAPEAPSQ